MSGDLTLFLMIFGFPILGLIIGYYRRNKKYSEITSGTLDQMVGWGLYGLGVVIIVGFIMIQFLKDVTGAEYEHKVYLYSLKNVDNTEGSFVLGSGSIETVEYYYYFYQGQYGYVRGSVPVRSTSIVETNDRQPELVEINRTFTDPTGTFVWQPMNSDPRKYIMYVPENTILRKFEVY